MTFLIWGPDQGIPPLALGQEEEVARKLNADVLIFGTVARNNERDWRVWPKFYLLPRTLLDVEGYANELFDGEYALGTSIPYDPGRFNSKANMNKELDHRLEALISMLNGLGQIAAGQMTGYEDALEVFEDIAQNTEWGKGKNAGQEILYLFIGGANFAQAMGIDTDSPERRQELLIAAQRGVLPSHWLERRLRQVVHGSGVNLVQLAQPKPGSDECEYDWQLVERAKQVYQNAMNLPVESQAESSPFEFHLSTGLGRIYYFIGTCRNDLNALQESETHFQRALQIYDLYPNPTKFLTEAAAYAHVFTAMILLGRADASQKEGNLSSIANDDLDKSISHFSQAFALLDQTDVEQSVGNAKIIVPYYLNALCMAGRDSDVAQFWMSSPGKAQLLT